jgi:hypothetical protein
MGRTGQPYRQHLPALDLSIERLTPRVPSDGGWYLLRGVEQVGRFRTLKAAQDEWDRIVAESGWKPEARAVDPTERIRAERAERWARNRAG